MFNILFQNEVRMAGLEERFMLLKIEKDVSFEQIAKAIHTNRVSLSKFVKGKYQMKKEMLQDLADYFDVDVAYLLGESDVKRQKIKLSEIWLKVSKAAERKKVPAEVLLNFIESLPKPEEK